ncbi:KH domain-containing protein [Haploplasma axanthum]|uniref:RNA-binding protein KhpA n=1 Tax=Haploplasma axanthum TaxID=29552 RepID=A0A449BFX5_HAPAX|nr:KH domain-containing protein [Haploplasma axanthum]VEU81200.1 Predicted RNA-binding protein (contains KH domain) [Haploplasma axanthum]
MAVNFENLLKSIIKPLVTNPDDVVVKILSEDSETVSISVIVHSDDLGRVIGKGGRIASAIRTIVYAGAAKENKRVQIDIDSY